MPSEWWIIGENVSVVCNLCVQGKGNKPAEAQAEKQGAAKKDKKVCFFLN